MHSLIFLPVLIQYAGTSVQKTFIGISLLEVFRGFRGISLELLKFYFSDRKQYARFNRVASGIGIPGHPRQGRSQDFVKGWVAEVRK